MTKVRVNDLEASVAPNDTDLLLLGDPTSQGEDKAISMNLFKKSLPSFNWFVFHSYQQMDMILSITTKYENNIQVSEGFTISFVLDEDIDVKRIDLKLSDISIKSASVTTPTGINYLTLKKDVQHQFLLRGGNWYCIPQQDEYIITHDTSSISIKTSNINQTFGLVTNSDIEDEDGIKVTINDKPYDLIDTTLHDVTLLDGDVYISLKVNENEILYTNFVDPNTIVSQRSYVASTIDTNTIQDANLISITTEGRPITQLTNGLEIDILFNATPSNEVIWIKLGNLPQKRLLSQNTGTLRYIQPNTTIHAIYNTTGNSGQGAFICNDIIRAIEVINPPPVIVNNQPIIDPNEIQGDKYTLLLNTTLMDFNNNTKKFIKYALPSTTTTISNPTLDQITTALSSYATVNIEITTDWYKTNDATVSKTWKEWATRNSIDYNTRSFDKRILTINIPANSICRKLSFKISGSCSLVYPVTDTTEYYIYFCSENPEVTLCKKMHIDIISNVTVTPRDSHNNAPIYKYYNLFCFFESLWTNITVKNSLYTTNIVFFGAWYSNSIINCVTNDGVLKTFLDFFSPCLYNLVYKSKHFINFVSWPDNVVTRMYAGNIFCTEYQPKKDRLYKNYIFNMFGVDFKVDIIPDQQQSDLWQDNGMYLHTIFYEGAERVDDAYISWLYDRNPFIPPKDVTTFSNMNYIVNNYCPRRYANSFMFVFLHPMYNFKSKKINLPVGFASVGMGSSGNITTLFSNKYWSYLKMDKGSRLVVSNIIQRLGGENYFLSNFDKIYNGEINIHHAVFIYANTITDLSQYKDYKDHTNYHFYLGSEYMDTQYQSPNVYLLSSFYNIGQPSLYGIYRTKDKESDRNYYFEYKYDDTSSKLYQIEPNIVFIKVKVLIQLSEQQKTPFRIRDTGLFIKYVN